MSTKYVLVDFENVQPDLSTLAGTPYKVKVFFGAKQQEGRVPFKLVDAMMALGSNVEAVKILRSGSNAVDMHIAYYIGRLIEKEPNASVHIISGDTDFDPLVEYLKTKGVSCKRAKTVADLAKHAEPAKSAAQARTRQSSAPARQARAAAPAPKRHDPRLETVMKQLHSLSGKPATRKKLVLTIANYFRQHREPLADSAVEHLIDELIRLKYVTQNGTRVTYHLS
jgi:hypothetical protein